MVFERIVVASAAVFVLVQLWLLRQAMDGLAQSCRSWEQDYSNPQVRQVFDRDAARTRLHSTLWAERHLCLLQRLTTVFPLLGVVITAGSVMFTQGAMSQHARADSSVGGSGHLLDAFVGTLFYGVMFGAALAIVNHAVLHVVTQRVHSTIARTDRLFPDWIPREPVARIDELVVKLGTAVVAHDQRIAHTLEGLGRTVDGLEKSMEDAAGTLLGAGKMIDNAASSLRTHIEGLATAAQPISAELKRSIEQAAQSLQHVGDSVKISSIALERATAQFGGSPNTIKAASDAMHNAAERFNEDGRAFHKSVDEVAESCRRLAAKLPEDIGVTLQAITEALRRAEEQFSRTAQASGKKLDTRRWFHRLLGR